MRGERSKRKPSESSIAVGMQTLKYSKVWRMDSWWGPGRCVHLCVYVLEKRRGRAEMTDVLYKVEIRCTFLNFLPISLLIIIFVFLLESH